MISRARALCDLRLVFLLVLVCAMWVPRPVKAEPLCESCEVQMGVGGTYHFWGGTDGVVLPLTVSWHESRYEAGVFRMASTQKVPMNSRPGREPVDPYWGVSVSRKWVLLERGPVRGFFGFGLAYRSQSDVLTVTHWDFASQLGLRMRLPSNGASVELALRHWSNAGIRQPNRGQDFATLTFLLNPQFFRTARLDRSRDLPFTRGQEAQAEIPPAMR
jgi:hypothetical protein